MCELAALHDCTRFIGRPTKVAVGRLDSQNHTAGVLHRRLYGLLWIGLNFRGQIRLVVYDLLGCLVWCEVHWPPLVGPRIRVHQLHLFNRGQLRLRRGVLFQPRSRAVVVIDDGHDASVVGGHHAHVRGREPAEGGACQPLSLLEQEVEHLVVRRTVIVGPSHRLRPDGQDPLRFDRLVEEGHAAADVRLVPCRLVRLVAPEVEQRDVDRLRVGPALVHEEVGEAVELQVGVEEDDGQVGRLELAQDECGLHGDDLEAEVLGALGRSPPKRVGRQQQRLAADADTLARSHQPAGLTLIRGRVPRDAHKVVRRRAAAAAHEHVTLVQLDAACLDGDLVLVVLVPRLPRARWHRHGDRAGAPQRVVRHRPQEAHVHARDRTLGCLACSPVHRRALACTCPLHALILSQPRHPGRALARRAALARTPPARW
eukprot:scaffold66611_cov65-Phaeocystis_antarctica.AAC.10